MRKYILATFLALPLAAVSAAPKAVTLDVQDMTCATCPITVKKSLEHVSGVSMVKIDFAKKTVTVTYDPEKAQPDVLIAATANAGYPSAVRK